MNRPILAALLITVAGCQSSPGSGPPEVWPSDPFPGTGEVVDVILEPYFERDRVQQVFGKEYEELGALPVRVAIRNNSESAQILDTKAVELLVGSTVSEAERHVGIPNVDGVAATLRGVIAMGGFGAVFGPNMERSAADSKAKQADAIMSRYALRSRTLEPGDQTDGFVYFFPGERGTPSASAAYLRFDLLRPGGGAPSSVLVPLPPNPLTPSK